MGESIRRSVRGSARCSHRVGTVNRRVARKAPPIFPGTTANPETGPPATAANPETGPPDKDVATNGRRKKSSHAPAVRPRVVHRGAGFSVTPGRACGGRGAAAPPSRACKRDGGPAGGPPREVLSAPRGCAAAARGWRAHARRGGVRLRAPRHETNGGGRPPPSTAPPWCPPRGRAVARARPSARSATFAPTRPSRLCLVLPLALGGPRGRARRPRLHVHGQAAQGPRPEQTHQKKKRMKKTKGPPARPPPPPPLTPTRAVAARGAASAGG